MPRRGDARVLGDPVQVAVGEQPLAERGEHDRAHAVAIEHVEQPLLDPAVQQRIGGLVDQQRRAELRSRISIASSVRCGE